LAVFITPSTPEEDAPGIYIICNVMREWDSMV